MIYTGLVSVTFRKLNPTQIVNLVSKAGAEILDIFSKCENNKKKPHYALLEFIKNDSEEQFLKDAAILKELVNK